MNQTNELRIMRRAEVLKILGISKTTLYERINDEKIPSSVSLGGRAVGWVSTEIYAVLNAIIKGDADEKIKALVVELIKKRNEICL